MNTELQIIAKQPLKWYVAYTRSNFEKVVATNLDEMGVASFLPLKRSVKQWSDRKKVVIEPIFRSYVFVNANMKGYYRALTAPGIIRFVTSAGKPVEVRQSEIDFIKQVALCENDVLVEPVKFFLGDKVLVTQGIFRGQTGILVEYRGKKRVAVYIDSIEISVLIDVPVDFLAKI